MSALHAVEQVVAVPMMRFERRLLGHLTRPEMIAVLDQPGSDWTSQRDLLVLSLLHNTGARVSEIVGVSVGDVVLGRAACVHLHGKGRKDLSVPLWQSTASALRAWLHANPDLRGSAALLPNRSGHPMTRCNVAQRLALAVQCASTEQPSLKTRRVSPHSLRRHATAMHPLQSGVPFNVIALCLGHESTNMTHRYVEATLEMKEKALARLEAADIKLKRFRASDDLMKFLQSLQPCKARRARARVPTQRTAVVAAADLRVVDTDSSVSNPVLRHARFATGIGRSPSCSFAKTF